MIDSINISDGLTPRYRSIADHLSSTRGLMARLGKTGEVVIKNRFEDLNRRPNKRGWPKQNVWNKIRQSTSLASVTEREATIAISDPRFAVHLHGGTITPKRARALAIPLHAEAYAAGSPREGDARLPNLFVLRRRGGRGAFLAEAEPFGQKGRVRIWYVLKASVRIPRNPDALPSESDMTAALDREARAYLDEVITREQN